MGDGGRGADKVTHHLSQKNATGVNPSAADTAVVDMKTNILSTIRRALLAGVVAFAVAQENVNAEGFGNALSFSGVNQYVSVPAFGSIAPTSEVTVEFWALTDAVAQQAAFMLEPDHAANRFNGHINYSNGNTYWDFGTLVREGAFRM